MEVEKINEIIGKAFMGKLEKPDIQDQYRTGFMHDNRSNIDIIQAEDRFNYYQQDKPKEEIRPIIQQRRRSLSEYLSGKLLTGVHEAQEIYTGHGLRGTVNDSHGKARQQFESFKESARETLADLKGEPFGKDQMASNAGKPKRFFNGSDDNDSIFT